MTVSTLVGHENPSGASGDSLCWLTVTPKTGLWGCLVVYFQGRLPAAAHHTVHIMTGDHKRRGAKICATKIGMSVLGLQIFLAPVSFPKGFYVCKDKKVMGIEFILCSYVTT